MRTRFIYYHIILFALLAILAFAAGAQTIPSDPALKSGKLPNGFTYFIRKNTQPAKRVQLHLVNKVGSILENEDQLGIAHFMEHMNFNGTKNFPKNELVQYLQKSGVRFGADLNAHTGFDETVYELPLPSDDPRLLENGIRIMRDWAQEATLDPIEIDKERGVILEEERLKKGTSDRMSKSYLPMMLNHSRYASRFPIGKDEILKTFQRPVIARFMKDWYRPDLQALIVVGDIEVDKIEKLITKYFSDLTLPDNPRQRINYEVPLTGKNQFLALTDKEMQGSSIEIIHKHRLPRLESESDYRKFIVSSIFGHLISSRRTGEINRETKPAYKDVIMGIQRFVGNLDMFVFEVSAKEGQLKEAFEQGFGYLERIKRYGFSHQELAEAKKNFLKGFETSLLEKDKTPSVNYVNEYKELFLNGTAAAGIEWESEFVKKNIGQINLEDIARCSNEYLGNVDIDLLLLAPEKDKQSLPDSSAIATWMKKVQDRKLEIFREEAVTGSLLTAYPKGGKIISSDYLPQIGLTRIKLSNGISVLLKNTDFKNDQIFFRGFRPGGTSLYGDDRFDNAANAAAIISRFGIGGYNPTQIKQLLSGKTVSVSANILPRSEIVNGGSSASDIETALQITYLQFTQPAKDPLIFGNVISTAKELMKSRALDPAAAFADTISAVTGNYAYRSMPTTPDRLDKLSLDDIYNIYRERFSDASGFTFVFVGSFNLDSIKPLISMYLGSLPDMNGKHAARDLGIHIPKGQITKTVFGGTEDKATIRLVYSGDYRYGPLNNLLLKGLGDILQDRLLSRLREKEGGVYSSSVQVSYSKNPKNRYAISISFGCAPENAEHLIAGVAEEMDDMVQQGVSADDVEKFKAAYTKNVELALKDNGFWLNYIAGQIENNESLLEVNGQQSLLNKIDKARLASSARHFFSQENLIRFILLPVKSRP